MKRSGLLLLLTLALGLACAPAPPSQSSVPSSQSAAAPKRVTAAITGDLHTFSNKLNPGQNVPGIDVVEDLLHAGLTRTNHQGVLIPRLAEAVPSLENGMWRLFPDGRMETTWTIRPGAQWHDGTPFTTRDLLFSALLGQDRELPNFRQEAYDSVDRVEVADDRTVRVHWRRPFIEADNLFTTTPLPAHILEERYATDKATFTEHPYWTNDFVGTGAFKLREWARGSHAMLEANDRYVLGRPRIDVLEVRFIPDQNTLIANVLAGQVELVLSRGLSLDQGLQAREQWRDGRMEVRNTNFVGLYPQFINPNPVVLLDVRFRRALLHGLNRQQIADVIYAGLVPVAHSFIPPRNPAYKEIEANIIRYDSDPRRAAQLIESIGYRAGQDGVYRDAANVPLSLQIRSSATRAERTQALFAIQNDWQQLGIAAEVDIVPPQRVGDAEYRATFPGVEFTQQPNELKDLRNFHSARAPVPENRFQISNNRGRYMNPAYDTLADRFYATIPISERMSGLRDITRHLSEELPSLGVIYGLDTHLIANRLQHVTVDAISWNAHEWDASG